MVNLPDWGGSNAVVQLSTVGVTARWVQFAVSGGGTVRIGGPNVSANLGIPIISGGYFFLPWPGQLNPYNLASIYCYIQSGATLSVAYEPFN